MCAKGGGGGKPKGKTLLNVQQRSCSFLPFCLAVSVLRAKQDRRTTLKRREPSRNLSLMRMPTPAYLLRLLFWCHCAVAKPPVLKVPPSYLSTTPIEESVPVLSRSRPQRPGCLALALALGAPPGLPASQSPLPSTRCSNAFSQAHQSLTLAGMLDLIVPKTQP